MVEPILEALRRTVERSPTPEELHRRVIESFGRESLHQARQLAAEIKGMAWLRGEQEHAEDVMAPATRGSLTAPGIGVLLLGSCALLIATLFPPFVQPHPFGSGFVTNAGFAFLFSPPAVGAVVNTSLLTILLLVVVVVTGVCFLIAREFGGPDGDPINANVRLSDRHGGRRAAQKR